MNKIFVFSLVVIPLFFSACSTKGQKVYRKYDDSQPTSYSSDKNNHSSVVDKKNYSHPTMRPYEVRGIRYEPTIVSVGDSFVGNASWYGPTFHGKLTSNGETYDMYDMTAAHKTLPMNTIVKVTNKNNGLTTVVRVNDRGPFIATRIIDLSKSAADKIDMVGAGPAPVTIEILGFKTKGSSNIPTAKELKENPQNQELKDFALQIASFSKIEGALKIQEKYNNTDGYITLIKDVRSGDQRSYKVWLKGFKSEQEARDYKDNSIFENSFIVRED